MTDELKPRRHARYVVDGIFELVELATKMTAGCVWIMQMAESFKERAKGKRPRIPKYPLGGENFESLGRKMDEAQRRILEEATKLEIAAKELFNGTIRND